MIALARPWSASPLVVGANRDEAYDRPAVAMAVLAESPRVLGGRDELAGGTWLAVSESGVVAGLTNRPMTEGRDPDKRSRGELPLALASHHSADEAVKDLVDRFRPTDYNPCWILVGDRRAIFSVDMTDGDVARVRDLPPGLHILENRPLDAPSAKVDHVRRLLGDPRDLEGPLLEQRLRAALSDHQIPPESGPSEESPGTEPARMAGGEVKRSACVHGERYGTRWSAVVTVPAGSEHPSIDYTDGPPCEASYRDAGWLWTGA